MGKDLKGKELGVGLSQRKDGFYTARFTDKSGKRRQQYFKKLQDCRKWLSEAQYNNAHGNIGASSKMTLDAWFDYWIDEIKGKTVRWSTIQGYKDRYNKNIREVIGNMPICDIKPLHCQYVLNIMDDMGYAGSSMAKTRCTMFTVFSDAVENGFMDSNPVTKSVKCPKKRRADTKVLTVEEQRKFLEAAKGSANYCHFLFVLQTGVRVSELRGLRWGDIDFEKRVIHIIRNVTYNSSKNIFVTGELKTLSGARDIPMTQTAYDILQKMKKERRKGNKNVISMEFADSVFLNTNGKPSSNAIYDEAIQKLCDKAGIQRISMHILRHTFATRCIEAGMKPKTLQKILGHADITTTMDLYVHVTEDEKEKEMKKFEKLCAM